MLSNTINRIKKLEIIGKEKKFYSTFLGSLVGSENLTKTD